MKQLPINIGELAFVFEDASWTFSHYLDTETGQVVMITEETRSQLNDLYEETYELDSESPPDLAALLQDSDLSDWEKEAVLEADQVEVGYGKRYIGVPDADPHQGYGDMEDFILTISDKRLQDRLWQAIQGRGAFRRFKDVLAGYRAEQERWYDFKAGRMEKRVLDWLASEGIEPLPVEPAEEQDKVPVPSDRSILLAEVLLFVQVASQLPDVTRIALIGSLATDKPDPKDADVLVTVTDDADLAPLATLGRKLQGHCQSHGLGGEVFLADPRGRYLGRTCPWKRCGPGMRISCDAPHCGQRPYLYDDLRTVRLEEELTAAPPIELWPEIVARVPVPEDVEGELLGLLRGRLR